MNKSIGWYNIPAWLKKSASVFTIVALTISTVGPLSIPSIAYADTLGFSSPTSTNESPDEWDNEDNAFLSNNVYATASDDSGDSRDDQRYRAFGFSVPSGAVINGIEIAPEGYTQYTSESETTVTPTVVGNYSQWSETGVSGTGDPQKVTAVSVDDGDTTYITESTNGEVQTFAVANAGIPAGSTIESVTLKIVAREDNGNAVIKLRVENGTGGGQQSDSGAHNLSSGYATYEWEMDENPLTDSDWTLAEVNSWTTKFGVVRTNSNSATPRVTQLYVKIKYKSAIATSCELQVRVGDGSSSSDFSAYKTATLSGTDTTYVVGGAADLWGKAWIPSDFSDANFRVEVRGNDQGVACNDAAKYYLDHLQAKVHYTPANGALVIEKVFAGNHAAATSTFKFQVNDGEEISFEEDGKNELLALSPGAYAVTEAAVPGYTPSYSAGCTAGVVSGATTTCTITNTELPGEVVVKKVLINDSVGQKILSEFSFSIAGGIPNTLPATVEGATSTLPAGTNYTVIENEAAAWSTLYTVSYSAGCSGVVGAGETKICIVTNNDIPQGGGEENISEEGNRCEITQTIVSDTLTLDDEGPATLLTFIHDAWDAIIPDALWIWSEEPLTDPAGDTFETFTRTFTMSGTPLGGTLEVAADNSYEVSLNGDPLCADPTENNFSSPDTCPIDAADLVMGSNTLTFTVKNWAQSGGTQESNPAGLLYKLMIDENTCGTTFSATKIVCPNESDLPNYGVGGDNTVSPSTFPITATTASDFLAAHPQCHLEPGWSWQWGPASELQPPMDLIGPAPAPWTTFTDTDNDGVTTFSVVPEAAGEMVWIREVMQDGYITFGGDNPYASYSSEMHCGATSQHFDNRDGNVLNGSTVYCVAWNAQVPQCVPEQELLVNGSFENPEVTDNALWDIVPSGTPGLGWLVSWFGGAASFGDQTRPLVANAEIQEDGLAGWITPNGSQWTELDSDWGGPNAPGSGEPGSVELSQTVGTVVGETYTFSFDFSPRPNTDASQNAVEVLANGLVIGTVGPLAASGSQTEWANYAFNVVATTSPTTFAVRDTGTPNDSLGTFVDNASLMCNPPNDYPTTTLHGSKIVCAYEEDLPNYGQGGEGEGSVPASTYPITETTAADFLESHPNCWLQPGWSWQWAPESAPNPELNALGALPLPWMTILDGDDGTVDGITEFSLDPDIIGETSIWIREVFQSGYVPFGGDNPLSSFSSEMHCGGTSQHFDNRDGNNLIGGGDLFCVAWNALDCEEGYHANVQQKQCVPNDHDYPPLCTEGQHFDEELQQCVPNGDGEPDPSILTIVKLTEGGDGTFGFSITGFGENSEFDENESLTTVQGTDSESVVLPGEGLYWVTEDTIAGWTLEDVICEYDNDAIGTEVARGKAITIVEEGDDVTCYFYNDKDEVEIDEPNDDISDTPPTDVCTNIEGVQETVPAGHTEANKICVPLPTNQGGGGSGGGGGGGGITGLSANTGSVLGAATQGQVLGETCGLYMNQYLRRGNLKNSTEQVMKLQEFLNKHGYGKFVPSGFFGPLTETAVKAFQQQYASTVLIPWGLTAPTGLAYLTTLWQLNLVECPALSLQIPQLIDWDKNPEVK